MEVVLLTQLRYFYRFICDQWSVFFSTTSQWDNDRPYFQGSFQAWVLACILSITPVTMHSHSLLMWSLDSPPFYSNFFHFSIIEYLTQVGQLLGTSNSSVNFCISALEGIKQATEHLEKRKGKNREKTWYGESFLCMHCIFRHSKH